MTQNLDTSAEASAQVAYQLRYLPDNGLVLRQAREDFAAHVEALAAQRDAAKNALQLCAEDAARLREKIAAVLTRLDRGIETFNLSPVSAPGIALVVNGKTRFANEEDVEALMKDIRAALAQKEEGK